MWIAVVGFRNRISTLIFSRRFRKVIEDKRNLNEGITSVVKLYFYLFFSASSFFLL